MSIKHTLRLLIVSAGTTALFAACAPAQPAKPTQAGVAVRSINYSGKEVELSVVDPLNKSNSGGGDALNPYSIGGTICCFGIPAAWSPGYQVIVKYTFYPDKKWHEQLVDVPPYADGKAGEIWLSMHDDGRAEAVVSNFGPTRDEWPGRVKGLPVPPVEYALKVMNDRLNTQRDSLTAMEVGLKADVSKMTQQEIERLKIAIQNATARIRLMETELTQFKCAARNC